MPWGYGGFGASQRQTDGALSVQIDIINCFSYDLRTGGSENVQTSLDLNTNEEEVAAVHFDFGDGTAWDEPGLNPMPYCLGPQPGTSGGGAPWHTFAVPGAYRITASVTFRSCTGGGDTTVTASITAYRIAGLRPPQN